MTPRPVVVVIAMAVGAFAWETVKGVIQGAIGDEIESRVKTWFEPDTIRFVSDRVGGCQAGSIGSLVAVRQTSGGFKSLDDATRSTYLCGDDRQTLRFDELLAHMAKRYPGCFEYSAFPSEQKTFRVRSESMAVCRTGFAKNPANEWVRQDNSATRVICIGDRADKLTLGTMQSPASDQTRPRECTEADLSYFGFPTKP